MSFCSYAIVYCCLNNGSGCCLRLGRPAAHSSIRKLASACGSTMSESSKAPTSASTSPLGNSRDVYPTPLARTINVNTSAKQKNFTPNATRAVREMLERKRQGQDGHARR
jgi:hypothetical protein